MKETRGLRVCLKTRDPGVAVGLFRKNLSKLNERGVELVSEFSDADLVLLEGYGGTEAARLRAKFKEEHGFSPRIVVLIDDSRIGFKGQAREVMSQAGRGLEVVEPRAMSTFLKEERLTKSCQDGEIRRRHTERARRAPLSEA